ncbi:hypothetical protein SUGI_0437970 [Cryptomeria japonica]|nr:hypothetical protein SUGI_0437970 [Cryptomeria japonica]
MLVLDRAGMIDRARSFISSGGSVPGTRTGIPITTPGNLQRPTAGTVPQRHRHPIKCIRPITHPWQWKHLDAVINNNRKGYHEHDGKSVNESYSLQFLCPGRLLQPVCTTIQHSDIEMQTVQSAWREI